MSVQIRRNPDEDGNAGDGSVAFTLTKPVDPALLDAELAERMNWRKASGIVVSGDLASASAKSPVTLWVMRDDVDAKALQSVVTAHKVPEPPEDRIAALREKAASGEGLDPGEMQEALRLLLG